MSNEFKSDTRICEENSYNYKPGYELPQAFQCGGVDNAGKVMTVDSDGYIRPKTGGGGGIEYTGSHGVIVDNTIHNITLDPNILVDTQLTGTTAIENATVTGDTRLGSSGSTTEIEGTLTVTNSTEVDFQNATAVMLGDNAICGTPTGSSAGDAIATKEYVDSKIPQGTLSKTWSELKEMRDAGTLVAGNYYRITDYVATTVQTNTQSANHPFDLIVFAIATNKLSENCYAAHHSGDTYFANSDLSTWDIWYCLDNNTNRFEWADNTNGKGVIYYLKDEFSNSAWYDWKGIQVKNTNTSDRFYYLFDNSGVDASLSPSTSFPNVHSNNLGSYIVSNKFSIGCNIFKGTIFNKNTIGNDFRSNTIGNIFNSNTIGNSFQLNTIGNSFQFNTTGNGFSSNTIGNMFNSNTIGNDFSSNTIGNSFRSNTIGSHFYNNTIGTSSIYINYQNNSFGNGIYYVDITDYGTSTTPKSGISLPSGYAGDSTTHKTLSSVRNNTIYYIGSDNTLKTLD